MLFYMTLDFIFGFTVKRYNKKAMPFHKATSIQCHEEIEQAFEWLKKRFRMPNVELYVGQNFNEINAYAIGSLRKKYINISIGLIHLVRGQASSEQEYVDAIKGILGHEMSHLSNKDYLPGLIVSANEAATRHVSFLFRIVFRIVALAFWIIPIIGKYIYSLIMSGYLILSTALHLFNRFLFFPIYKFLMNWFGRSIEYRCDRESAKVFGGKVMAQGLSMIGGGGYLTVFSTHPSTKNRISHVKDARPEGGEIVPGIITSISNFISVILVVAVCIYSTYKTDVPGMYEHYMEEVHKPMLVHVEQAKVFFYNVKSKF